MLLLNSNFLKLEEVERMAEEAKAISRGHQVWILEALKEAPEQQATYQALVEVGEEKQCDTLGAMLKVLKSRKVVEYSEQILMYPKHKEVIIKLTNPEYDPLTAA